MNSFLMRFSPPLGLAREARDTLVRSRTSCAVICTVKSGEHVAYVQHVHHQVKGCPSQIFVRIFTIELSA